MKRIEVIAASILSSGKECRTAALANAE